MGNKFNTIEVEPGCGIARRIFNSLSPWFLISTFCSQNQLVIYARSQIWVTKKEQVVVELPS